MGRFASIQELISAVRRGAADMTPSRSPQVEVVAPRAVDPRVTAHKTLRNSWPMAEDAADEDVMAALGEFSPEQQKYLQALRDNDWLGFDYPSQAASSGLAYADAPSRWEMSPELLAARQGLIDSHAAAPRRGTTTSPDALYDSSGRSLVMDKNGWPAGTETWAARPGMFDGVDAAPTPEPDFALDSPLFRDMYKADQAFDNIRKGRTGNLRNQNRDLVRIASDNIRSADEAAKASAAPRGVTAGQAAALAGVGAGLGIMVAPKDMGLKESGNPADLADEEPISSSAPLSEEVLGGMDESELMQPVVSPKPAMAPVASEPADPSLQARELINKLNDMRRAAGGEVPEAPAMMKEINRLIALGNEQRRDPAYSHPKADPARDPYQQARGLISQVNQMYRQGASPNSPEVQRIMSEVRRLQGEGDAIRNRRVG